MLVNGLSFGYSRNHVQAVSGGSGESNDRFHASMKVMPNMGVSCLLRIYLFLDHTIHQLTEVISQRSGFITKWV